MDRERKEDQEEDREEEDKKADRGKEKEEKDQEEEDQEEEEEEEEERERKVRVGPKILSWPCWQWRSRSRSVSVYARACVRTLALLTRVKPNMKARCALSFCDDTSYDSKSSSPAFMHARVCVFVFVQRVQRSHP